MPETFTQAYQALVMRFAEENNLELEVAYDWPAELEAEFSKLFRELQVTFGRTPL